MIKTGLVSITFRQLLPKEIVELVRQAQLDGIEWGGDIHVPHGDISRAREVRQICEDNNIAIAAYGAYYRAGHSEHDGLPFARVLETALELGAPSIRVWPGKIGSNEADAQYRKQVVDDTRRICELAQEANVGVALEYHPNTLTDTTNSAIEFIEAINHPNLQTYWQPNPNTPITERAEGLRAVLPHMRDLHVFQWANDENGVRQRLDLSEGKDEWREYFSIVNEFGGDRFAMLEFVRGDAPEQFLRDAQTLREWLNTKI